MEKDVWRGQIRAPLDVIEWFKEQGKDRFTSLNSVMVEALREYRDRRKTEERSRNG
ncbi:hypothetical protein QP575_10335 [Alcaligenes faecalis subsp. phenolicus]|uniref:hypothetical protein n=1 Tax=Alcaligenes nematophilus TaxID=2994643 RepID=UPI002AA2C91A|nr:hypothetical protein [Alcaligenes phenolicus]